MRFLLKKKDTQRRIVNKVRSQSAKKKYDDLRRAAKQLLAKKRQEHVHKLKNLLPQTQSVLGVISNLAPQLIVLAILYETVVHL